MSDEFRDYREQRNGAIHINMDMDANNQPTSSAHTNGSPNTFHTMINRVRQHTNLNSVLTPNALRSLISNSNIAIQGFQQPTGQTRQGFRYTPLINQNSLINNPAENVHILLNDAQRSAREPIENPSNIRRNRLESDATNFRLQPPNLTTHHRSDDDIPATGTDSNQNDIRATFERIRQEVRLDEDNNNTNIAFSDILVKFLSNFVRYLPFLIILLVKFIHDHLVGLTDIAILQAAMWYVNKSLIQQVSKLSQKSFLVLLRDLGLIAAAIAYRILPSGSGPPDPFGLMINPPAETITIEITSNTSVPNMENSPAVHLLKKFLNSPNVRTSVDEQSALQVTRAVSLGLLLYYVVINDLILKLLTVGTKILITMLPSRCLRYSQRARLYVLLEYFFQFYRALVPMRQWGKFLFESYYGLEVISGILLSAFYMGAKGLEFASRGKVLHYAFMNLVRNIDYERKPTKSELDAAGENCPICHDTYKSPVILTCNHIFCDDCVGQWFRREQTCPMCRAKVSEDPQWQDGATTFFYQLC